MLDLFQLNRNNKKRKKTEELRLSFHIMQIKRKEKIIFSKRKHKLFMLKHCFPKKSFNIQSPSYIVITNVVGHKNDNNNFLKHVTMLRVATLIKQSYLYQCTMQNQRGVVSILNMACNFCNAKNFFRELGF